MSKSLFAGTVCALLSMLATAQAQVTEVRTFTGVGNTIGGEAETPLLRVAPAAYPGNNSGEKIRGEPQFPNARDVSNAVAAQAGPDLRFVVSAPKGRMLTSVSGFV